MTDDLKRLTELRDRDPDVKSMCRSVLNSTGCNSLAELMDRQPDAFDMLLEGAESMVDQLGAP